MIITDGAAASLRSPQYCVSTLILVGELVLNTANGLVKFSVVLFYARVFTQPLHFKSVLWVVGAVIWCFYVVSQIVGVLGFIGPGRRGCLDENNVLLYPSILNVLIDFTLLFLPLPLLFRLNLGRTRKFGLVLVFMVGYR